MVAGSGTRPLGRDITIHGPFNDKTPTEMENFLGHFMEGTGLDQIYRPLFQKAMYLAQYWGAFDEQREDGLTLTATEKEHLRVDKVVTTNDSNTRRLHLKKWRLPPRLFHLIALCALGALVQGCQESAVNSAQLYYQDAFKIWVSPPADNLTPHPWYVGLVNSAPYLCCFASCWLTHPLNLTLGRRGTIFLCCVCSALFAFLQSLSQTWETMFALRLAMGVGIGPQSATIPIYAAETAPENIRGGLVMMWQAFTAVGIMLGYIMGVAFQSVGADGSRCPVPSADTSDTASLLATPCSLKWRLMIGSPMVAPIILAMYVFTVPESPRWLIAKGHIDRSKFKPEKARSRYKEAFNGLQKVRHTNIQAARDMFLMYFLLEREREAVEESRQDATKKWYVKGVFELLSIRRNRRALIASLTCMFAQQFW